MTEKDFKALCLAGFSDPLNLEMTLETAIRLAKKAEAKFDPEPAKLPQLVTDRIDVWRHSVITAQIPGYPKGRALTGQEAREVVRRCDAIEKLREFLLATTTEGVSVSDIMDIIQCGRERERESEK